MNRRRVRRDALVSQLGPLESRVMDAAWNLESASVRDIIEALGDATESAYTTIQTIMTRLAEKKLLDRTLSGRAYVYRPTLTKREYDEVQARGRVRKLINDFGDLAVAQFAEELQEVDPQRARQLGALLRRRDNR